MLDKRVALEEAVDVVGQLEVEGILGRKARCEANATVLVRCVGKI